MEETFKTYLFEYRHDGSTWGIEIKARNESDAAERLKALAWARYVGEGVLKVHVPVSFLGRFSRGVRALFTGRASQ